MMALIALAPVVASYAAYYWLTPSKRVNYGELLDTVAAPDITGAQSNGKPFALADMRGKWLLVVVADRACADSCRRTLHATRQARTIQGREQDRVARALLQPIGVGAWTADLDTEHADLVVAAVSTEQLARLPPRVPAGPGDGLAADANERVGVLLLDPRGNLVLRYPADPDIKRLANDLKRLLSTSQIG